jgi:hypothetical protein
MFELQIDAKPFEAMVERMGDAMNQMPFRATACAQRCSLRCTAGAR